MVPGSYQMQQYVSANNPGYRRATCASQNRQHVGRSTSFQGSRSQAMAPMTNPGYAPAPCPVRGTHGLNHNAVSTRAEGSPGGPAPVQVKITAAQLANASSSPLVQHESGQTGVEGQENVKYIQLKWDDILGKSGVNVSTYL